MTIDLTPAIQQFLYNFLYLIPFLFLIAFFKSPRMKGFLGESIVNIASYFALNKKEYRQIRNVTLPSTNGTTQIDHIIVSRYGVFVIETKNMKGWIFGDPVQKIWTQKIYKQTNKFQNPLHQNQHHVNILKKILGLDSNQIHSLIVFIGESTFKTPMPSNVTQGLGYIRYIKSKLKYVLTKEQADRIAKQIELGRLTPSFKTHNDHVENVKKALSERQAKNLCPRCGSPMVLRAAKKAPNAGKKFLGCSKFPECKGTANID